MGEVLKKFGRYFLLDQIAQGGMAEIYRARLAAAEGGGRLLVIKRIQAGFGDNTEFLQMFKSEIKVTMGFSHPNIVQLYDFGEEQNQPYIAMEFVDGKNLRQFLSRLTELKQSFPVDMAAYLIEQAASGLHYAHCYKDKISGQALNIVHRDISPQNILISYDGNAKIIDFGIAKATTNSESTRAGVIKGKPSYLSPEQISGEPLDGRCDVFALGIVLWELLTTKKLFAGENDLAVLKLIESCNQHVKPPSTLNPKVPKELDYIVLKSLAKQREKRYQSGEELQRALHKFLYTFNADFNPGDLAYFAKDLFKNEIVEDRKKLQRLSEKADQLLLSDVPDLGPITETQVKPRREDTTTIVDSRAARPKPATKPSTLSPNQNVKVEMEPSFPRNASRPRTIGTSTGSAAPPARGTGTTSRSSDSSRGKLKPWLFGVIGLGAVILLGPEFGIRLPVVSDLVDQYAGTGTGAELVLKGNAKGVVVTVNGRNVATELPTSISGVVTGAPVKVVVSGPGISFQQDLILTKGEKRELAVATPTAYVQTTSGNGAQSAQDLANVKSVLLRLNVVPGGGAATMAVNGRPVDPSNPSIQVPLDAPLELVAERPGFRSFRREFVLESRQIGGLKEWMMDVQLEPVKFGYLTIRTTPTADATILIDGKPWVRKTPIENEKIPIGTYSIRLTNDVLGMEKNVTLSIQEGKAVTVDERLEIKN